MGLARPRSRTILRFSGALRGGKESPFLVCWGLHKGCGESALRREKYATRSHQQPRSAESFTLAVRGARAQRARAEAAQRGRAAIAKSTKPASQDRSHSSSRRPCGAARRRARLWSRATASPDLRRCVDRTHVLVPREGDERCCAQSPSPSVCRPRAVFQINSLPPYSVILLLHEPLSRMGWGRQMLGLDCLPTSRVCAASSLPTAGWNIVTTLAKKGRSNSAALWRSHSGRQHQGLLCGRFSRGQLLR